MATLQSAKAKYANAIRNMPTNYNNGMAGFLGVSATAVASSGPGLAYSGKVKPGLENKWETKLRQAFGG